METKNKYPNFIRMDIVNSDLGRIGWEADIAARETELDSGVYIFHACIQPASNNSEDWILLREEEEFDSFADAIKFLQEHAGRVVKLWAEDQILNGTAAKKMLEAIENRGFDL